MILLCCHDRANRNVNIVIYNVETEGEVKQIGLSESPRKNYYQWGGYTGVDLAVDEQGLWVLVGYTKGNSYELMLRNKDVYRSQIVPYSWSLGTVTGDYSYTLGEKKFSNQNERRLAF